MAVEPHDKAAKDFLPLKEDTNYSSPNETGWILTDTPSVSSYQAHFDRSNPLVPYSLAPEPFLIQLLC